MNAIMNPTQLCHCDICNKTNITESKSKHISSNTHKHKQKYGNVVLKKGFIKPDVIEVNFIPIDAIRNCRKKYFHSFEYWCAFDFKFIYMENNEEVMLTITLGFMK